MRRMIGVNRVKTWVLIAALAGLFVAVGAWIGGGGGGKVAPGPGAGFDFPAYWLGGFAVGAWIGGGRGATIALGLGLVFNFAMYWWSDRIAIAATRSKPVSEADAPELHAIVRELAAEAGAPLPRIYVSEMAQPNAFATGRNPDHAAVSVTRGILQILDRRELRGVLAHELSHVLNRDILVSSVASAIGTAFTYLAYMVMFFGGDDDDSPLGIFGFLLVWILAPLAAGLIQMAVSRSREYQADES